MSFFQWKNAVLQAVHKNIFFKIALPSLLLTSALTANPVQAQTLCVFDLSGASGDYFAFMKDYALAAQKWSVEISLRPYNKEESAINDYKQGKCDAVSATSFTTREFNKFTGSINAVGAIPNNTVAKNLLLVLGSPKLAPEMVENGHEVLGALPIGSAYLTMKDRTINSMTEIEGKRVAVLASDPVQQRMIKRIGGTPVFMEVDTAGLRVQDRNVDIVPLPSYSFDAFEVYRALGTKGGISRFPVSFMTMNLIARQKAFPENFAAKSRLWFSAQSPRLMKKIQYYDNKVPERFWLDVPASEQSGYFHIIRQMRLEFVQNQTYHPKMMNLLKRLRCQQDAQNFECKSKGE